MRDLDEYLKQAESLEEAAIELGDKEPEAEKAISKLITAADADLSVLRRAHRHLEQKVKDRAPGAEAPLRAFFLLSAARQRLEVKKV